MSNLFCWLKGLGVVIGSAIAFSGSFAIAKMNQDATLPNNELNTSNFSTVLEKHNTSRDNAQKFNYSIDQTQSQIQDQDTVENEEVPSFTGVMPPKSILLASCGWYNGKYVCIP